MIFFINNYVITSSALIARSYNEIMIIIIHVLRKIFKLNDEIMNNTEMLQQNRCL